MLTTVNKLIKLAYLRSFRRVQYYGGLAMMLKSVHLFFPGNRHKIRLFSFTFNVEYLKEGIKFSTSTSSFKMRCSQRVYVLLDSYSEI